ncbi:DegV family protein [Thomasclavelia cocleata]|jgi:DegV family protein with EDD domain|uniref:DegV domain-containing protein n=1 Tax=Thomasclavelia cocleata TaxID=69824 RepID=A0A829ZC99_9FIRM|nr:DegV family protein [Thomasclavelia cocleata]MCI9132025.1 DegV family protein [Thomasclavelia cocleata]MCI9629582.1 DegV family protein [Thomasclavelia cocleata]GFI42170.1 DegV domain-containing protein [Thomasclavelia cocleata]
MYKIITDGSCDLPLELVKQLDIDVIPFYVSIDGINHQKEIIDLGVRDFYQFMIDNPKVFPKTSMPSIQDYIDVFEPIIKNEEDVICICITTKFSGSYNSAMNAKNMLLDKYPDAKIEIIDATVNTVLQGMLVEEAVVKKNTGATFEETVKYVNLVKETGRIFFTINGMDYLVHGGRVGKLSGIAAGALGIKPLILLKEGEIFNNGLTRGRKKSKQKIVEQIISYFKDNELDINEYRFCIGFGYDKEEAIEFKEQFIKSLEQLSASFNDEIPIRQIGATIGVHTGPHPLGVGLLKKCNKK